MLDPLALSATSVLTWYSRTATSCNDLITIFLVQDVAFYARSISTISNFSIGRVLAFSDVITNTGEAYDSSTGKFTAPTNGHFVFSWTMVCTTVHGVDTILMLNGQNKGVAQADCRQQNGSGSNTVVLKLSQGDVVHLEAGGIWGSRQVWGDTFSTFSGWRILY